MSRPIPETEILKPRDPSLLDTDQWPEFVLSNVNVHIKDDENAPASLLDAAEGNPLTVLGKLQPLDEEDAHLYVRAAPIQTRVNIILEDVYTFSYGQYGDGSTAIWAAGKAGWYTIKPGRSYRIVYEGMVAAVNILYFVADAYREERTEGHGKHKRMLPYYSAQELFAKYAAEELGSNDATEGAEKLYEYKDFLITAMITGKEGLSWSQYPIYHHFHKKFPDVWSTIKRRQMPMPAKSKSRAKHGSQGSDATIPGARHKANSRSSRQGSTDTTSTNDSQRRRIGRQAPIALSRAVEVISLDGSSDAGSQKSGVSSKGVKPSRPSARRVREENSERTAATSIFGQYGMVDVDTPVKDDDNDMLRARKNKSSLRPRASKAAKSAARKGAKVPATAEEYDEDDLVSPTSPTAGKRKLVDPEQLRPTPKRRSSRQHVDEGIDIPTSPSNSGEADDATSPATDASTNGIDVPIRTLKHLDPVQEDTWVCALDGCTHKVYAASTPEAQLLIKQHYNLHAFDDDERVQMIKSMQAPSLPASRLMERVKLQAKAEGFAGSQQMAPRFPAVGIVQKY